MFFSVLIMEWYVFIEILNPSGNVSVEIVVFFIIIV